MLFIGNNQGGVCPGNRPEPLFPSLKNEKQKFRQIFTISEKSSFWGLVRRSSQVSRNTNFEQDLVSIRREHKHIKICQHLAQMKDFL